MAGGKCKGLANAPALILGGLLLVFGVGCNGDGYNSDQILARVNNDEITIHQFNFALSQTSGKKLNPAAQDELLNKMIDRQLAVQQAVQLKIDRRPEVITRLEEARLDILAAAYAYEHGSFIPPPTPRAIADYYARHPGLFAQRKVYSLREITLATGMKEVEQLKRRLQEQESLTQVLTWLRSETSQFGDQQVMRVAEKLPTEVADQLCQETPGAIISFATPQVFVVYQLLSAEDVPISIETATPVIRNYLQTQEQVASYRGELERIRNAANIVVTMDR